MLAMLIVNQGLERGETNSSQQARKGAQTTIQLKTRMKSIIISTGNGPHDKSGDLRLQTRPSGDLEIVEVSRGPGENRPANQIKGVVERECIATDGANLAHWTLPSISAEFECLIPADFADALAGALERENAVFKLSNNQAFVEWQGGFYVCKLSEFQFPSITAITGNKFDRLGKLTTRPLLRECEACIALTNQAMTAALDLEFMADGLFTRFGGTNENHFTGDFKPAYKCTVNAKSAKLCLGAIGETCEFFGNKVATKMVNCDLTIYSTLMLAH